MDNGLSMAMLGWKAHETTRNTLRSWKRAELDRCGELFVFFNQMTDADRAVVDEFGIASYGTERNLGIWNGMEEEARIAKGDYLLFLDNDHEAIVSPEETRHWIDSSLDLLRSGKADTVILLNRWERLPGWGDSHFFDYHYIRELDPRARGCLPYCPSNWDRDTFGRRIHRLCRPFAARRRLNGAAPYLEAHPEKVYPRYIAKAGEFYLLDSAIQPFCEAPVMMSRRFFERISAWGRKHPRKRTILGFQELEYVMNRPWWRGQHFKTAICDGGIFSHRRLDDSWRANHASFNREMIDSEGASA